jgi:uncharacterized protein (DUF2252 family)
MDTTAATRAELYERARQLELAGRSTMNRSELEQAVAAAERSSRHGETGDGQVADRFEAFERLASERAAGAFQPTPIILTGEQRRLHVRQTIREDHQHRITTGAEDAEEKFDALAESVFDFFRGTALLFYRDMAGDDSWMPTVLNLGDVHPANFGVMPSSDNVPIFSVNDFDEAAYAPFTWDLKRGAVGFAIAGGSEGDLDDKRQRKLVRRFVRGYVDGVTGFAEDANERDLQVRLDNAPPLIREMIDDEWEDRREWLEGEYYDEFRRGFRADDELVPISSRREEFQEIVDRLVVENDLEVPDRAASMKVKDVAVRRHQGTASLGLERFYVLIEGPMEDESDDIVLELKRARRSALTGLVPPSEVTLGGAAARIAHAQQVQLVRGDVFFGHVDIDGRGFMSRERAPYRGDVDLDDLSWKEWKTYARICGRTLAHAHALSDDGVGSIERDIEPEILDAIGDPELFVDDIARFAMEAAERVRTDHEHFRADHELGAFRRVDHVYR